MIHRLDRSHPLLDVALEVTVVDGIETEELRIAVQVALGAFHLYLRFFLLDDFEIVPWNVFLTGLFLLLLLPWLILRQTIFKGQHGMWITKRVFKLLIDHCVDLLVNFVVPLTGSDCAVVLSLCILNLYLPEPFSDCDIEEDNDVETQNRQCNSDQNPSTLISRIDIWNEVSEDNQSICADQAHRFIEDLRLVLERKVEGANLSLESHDHA